MTPQYHDLGEDFPTWLAWTNKKEELDLDTFFDPTKPNLATGFDVKGLKPVIRERGETGYLLEDDKNGFYYMDIRDGRLFKFVKVMNVDQAVQKVLEGWDKDDIRQQFASES